MQITKPIILIGPMGTGKSTIARALAGVTNLVSLDVDTKIEYLAYKTIPQIFKDDGEDEFRKLETEALKYCLDCGRIVATGGGIVVRDENLELLKHGFVVYLYTSVEEQYKRTLLSTDRPLLQTEDRLAKLQELFTQRDPKYKAACNLMIDTQNYTVSEICALIVKAMHDRGLLIEE